MKFKQTFLAFFITSLISCQDKLDKRIVGVYVIDKMTYLDQSCIDAYLVNMINIDETTLRIPTRNGYENYLKIDSAHWTLDKTSQGYVMTINSIDPIFNRKFIITYDNKDKSKTAKMTLLSDSVKIYCTKTPELR